MTRTSRSGVVPARTERTHATRESRRAAVGMMIESSGTSFGESMIMHIDSSPGGIDGNGRGSVRCGTMITIPSQIRGLVFDCDGTIADTMPAHYKAWVEALGKFNVEFPEALFYEMG